MRNDACLGPGTAVQFEYDHNGLRTKKIVTESGVTTVTEYLLHGSLVTHLTKGTDSLHFYYDAASRPAFVDYNGTMYAYVHNLQGDITGILDSTGTLVVTYGYDAWGKPVQTNGSMANTLGKINPFRYRGYVLDEETGLYYLQSRYFHSLLSRFISTDLQIGVVGKVHGVNIYAYCDNNPVNRYDPTGTDWDIVGKIGLALVIGGLFALFLIATGGGGLPLAFAALGASATVSATAMTTAAAMASTTVLAGMTLMTESHLHTHYYSGGRHPTDVGKEGERQAGIDQKGKSSFEMHGRKRVPDQLRVDKLVEDKKCWPLGEFQK